MLMFVGGHGVEKFANPRTEMMPRGRRVCVTGEREDGEEKGGGGGGGGLH